MTVNANVRCVEWFDASIIKPTEHRFVIGWYPEHLGGICITVRLLNDNWWFEGDAIGLPQDATPTHWCEFPDGPGNSGKPEDPRMADVRSLVARGKRIDATKLYRAIHGCGLKEAAQAVEAL